MSHRVPTIPRRHQRHELVLKVEFEDAAGFRSNYLHDLSEGGVRINSNLEVGQHLMLNISFLGFVEPMQIEAIVQWTLPASHPDGPASGLAFVDPNVEARAWLADVLDASTQVFVPPETPSRVILFETEPFLVDIYGQEVRNWSELRDEEPLELIATDDVPKWLLEVTRAPATLGILDIDDIVEQAWDLYHRVRTHTVSAELPLIVLGMPQNIERFLGVSDELLFALRKPLKFGILMNTVRVLARTD